MQLEPAVADTLQTPQESAETGELLLVLRRAIEEDLTTRQREVLVALTFNGVPIDVLAQRIGSTRGALYKTLHDARSPLRATLRSEGLTFDSSTTTESS